jgi:outer membrane lipoprotein carrier protein
VADTALLRRFEERYRNPTTLAATFLERYLENGRVLRVEAGQAYFLRPGKMRWEYESPERNLFLVDGKTAWFYVPADHTVTRVPAKESADWRTPLALLAGKMKLSRFCARIQSSVSEKPESPENVVFSCEFRAQKVKSGETGSQGTGRQRDDAWPSVYFEVARNTGDLVRLVVQDAAQVAVEFHFKNWQFDLPVQDSLFRFRVPPGIAIVNGELPAGQNALNP